MIPIFPLDQPIHQTIYTATVFYMEYNSSLQAAMITSTLFQNPNQEDLRAELNHWLIDKENIVSINQSTLDLNYANIENKEGKIILTPSKEQETKTIQMKETKEEINQILQNLPKPPTT